MQQQQQCTRDYAGSEDSLWNGTPLLVAVVVLPADSDSDSGSGSGSAAPPPLRRAVRSKDRDKVVQIPPPNAIRGEHLPVLVEGALRGAQETRHAHLTKETFCLFQRDRKVCQELSNSACASGALRGAEERWGSGWVQGVTTARGWCSPVPERPLPALTRSARP